jgi:hypothetical protein
MRSIETHMASSIRNLRFLALFALAVSCPHLLHGQTPKQGNNAVYSSTTAVSPSAAYIDAKAFASPSTTICATLYSILSSSAYPGPGALIDARGLNATTSKMTCAANESPWLSSSTYYNVPSRILLPAGTIVIAYPWLLPDYTKLVGVGSSSSSGAAGTTTIQAGNGLSGQPTFSGSQLIQMGGVPGSGITVNPAAACSICFEISLTDLTLDAQGQALDGVDNSNAEELSYLQRVAILNTEGTGLYLATTPNPSGNGNLGTASHSGPYLDLYISAGSKAVSSTACIKVDDSQPRGLHGVTCTASSTTAPNAGIYLDGGNVSIENVLLSGFTDGILVGSETQQTSLLGLQDIYADVLANIAGSTPLTNLIHICNPSSLKGNCLSGGFSPVDIAISGVTGASGINTIEDDLTNTTLTDTVVALYDLGEPVQGGGAPVGYSRFSSSPSVPAPTWLVGTASAPNNASCTAVANGSLYSRGSNAASGSNTLWGCIGGKWVAIK